MYALPHERFFIALVVIGTKEIAEAELLIPLCSPYTQKIYRKTVFASVEKWLMLEIRNKETLQDAQNLIALRIPMHKRV